MGRRPTQVDEEPRRTVTGRDRQRPPQSYMIFRERPLPTGVAAYVRMREKK